MIIPVSENVPHILLWMDWKLYQYQDVFLNYIACVLFLYFLMDKKYRAPLPVYLVITIAVFFVRYYIQDGKSLG